MMTASEVFLFVWALLATIAVVIYREGAKVAVSRLTTLLMSQHNLIKMMLEDDDIVYQMRKDNGFEAAKYEPKATEETAG